MDCSAYHPLSICHTHEYFRLKWIWQLFIANKQICTIKGICRKVKPECWSNGDAISIPISTQVALSESPFLQDETGYFGEKYYKKSEHPFIAFKSLIFNRYNIFKNVLKITYCYRLFENHYLPYPKTKTTPVRKNRQPLYIFVCDIDLERKTGKYYNLQ